MVTERGMVIVSPLRRSVSVGILLTESTVLHYIYFIQNTSLLLEKKINNLQYAYALMAMW